MSNSTYRPGHLLRDTKKMHLPLHHLPNPKNTIVQITASGEAYFFLLIVKENYFKLQCLNFSEVTPIQHVAHGPNWGKWAPITCHM